MKKNVKERTNKSELVTYINNDTESVAYDADLEALVWKLMIKCIRENELHERQDYRVLTHTKTMELVKRKSFYKLEPLPNRGRRLMMVCKHHCADVVNIRARHEGIVSLYEPRVVSSYLERNPAFLGVASHPHRFTVLDGNGKPLVRVVEENGKQVEYGQFFTERPLVFDYDMICRQFGCDITDLSKEEPDENVIKRGLQYLRRLIKDL